MNLIDSYRAFRRVGMSAMHAHMAAVCVQFWGADHLDIRMPPDTRDRRTQGILAAMNSLTAAQVKTVLHSCRTEPR